MNTITRNFVYSDMSVSFQVFPDNNLYVKVEAIIEGVKVSMDANNIYTGFDRVEQYWGDVLSGQRCSRVWDVAFEIEGSIKRDENVIAGRKIRLTKTIVRMYNLILKIIKIFSIKGTVLFCSPAESDGYGYMRRRMYTKYGYTERGEDYMYTII